MISLEIFNRLKEIETSSWAVWDEENSNSLFFFLSKLEFFHGKVIFVGLNRSNVANNSTKVLPLSNFHTKGHVGDRRLKRFVQEANLTNLIGGFMTDISDQIETNSNQVKFEKQNAVKKFIEKIRLIDNSRIRHIICFGDKVFNTFISAQRITKGSVKANTKNKIKEFDVEIDNETWHFYRVWHYSNYGAFIHKSQKELPEQLKYVNDKIKAK